MAKIYVGNLAFTASEADVRALFSQHGNVDAVSLPTDREIGRPRGFGFVEMSHADAARATAQIKPATCYVKLLLRRILGSAAIQLCLAPTPAS
jgi:RNA recognition motif-containing protein